MDLLTVSPKIEPNIELGVDICVDVPRSRNLRPPCVLLIDWGLVLRDLFYQISMEKVDASDISGSTEVGDS